MIIFQKKIWLVALAAVTVGLVFAAVAIAVHVPDPKIKPEIIRRKPDTVHGAYIAVLGDCSACHTTSKGKFFAGGAPFPTPVGTVYSSNITPDIETGIGKYSFRDFVRVMRYGVTPDGSRLYPAMPYTAYDKVTDEDLQDLFSYLKSNISPVRSSNMKTEIKWPLSMRWPLAFWNLAFHRPHPFKPDLSKSPQWNRGAYLVEGLAHCGTCHTPRGFAFQEKNVDGSDKVYLSGSSLNGSSPINLRGNYGTGLGQWTSEDIAMLLKTGSSSHSSVIGPMAEVVTHSTQYMTNEDILAIASYLKSLSPSPTNQSPAFVPDNTTLKTIMAGRATTKGAQIFMNSCSACHRLSGNGADKAFPRLAGNAVVLAKDPSSLIAVILNGATRPATAGAPSELGMPGFGWRYNDEDIAALASFVRTNWGNNASMTTSADVRKIRHSSD